MVTEAELDNVDYGLVPTGSGWYVLNAQKAAWFDKKGRAKRFWYPVTRRLVAEDDKRLNGAKNRVPPLRSSARVPPGRSAPQTQRLPLASSPVG